MSVPDSQQVPVLGNVSEVICHGAEKDLHKYCLFPPRGSYVICFYDIDRGWHLTAVILTWLYNESQQF